MSAHLSFPEPWLSMVVHAGGSRELAGALGIARITLWRWSRGHTAPSRLAREAVNRWARSRKIAAPWP